jgi:hypothetical protein
MTSLPPNGPSSGAFADERAGAAKWARTPSMRTWEIDNGGERFALAC